MRKESTMLHINLTGREHDVYAELANSLDIDSNSSEQIITFLQNNSEILSADEEITTSIEAPAPSIKGMGLIIMKKNLHINVKVATILTAALLLDIYMTNGFAQLIVGMFGVNGHAIVPFSEKDGEKCIIIETLRTHNKVATPSLLSAFNGLCCNNNLKCRYRLDDRCHCTHKDVGKILEGLTERNILKKEGELYKYQW